MPHSKHLRGEEKKEQWQYEPIKESAQNPFLTPRTSQGQKEKKNIKEAPSKEDWEGGGSRPQWEEYPRRRERRGKGKASLPAPVEAGEKKHEKNLKSDAQRRQRGEVCQICFFAGSSKFIFRLVPCGNKK